jgi:hypothetical protein
LLTVVTSFSPAGYEQYGKAFLKSFSEFWPLTVKLLVAWEGDRPPGVHGFDLLNTEPCASFIARHKNNAAVSGLQECLRSRWGPKARREGYSFRHDAYKFARKVFAVAHASRRKAYGKMFWIDADTTTHARMSESVLHRLLPDDVSLCYLARPGTYSELGFVGYNLQRQEAREFIQRYERRYADDEFLDDPAWDDCWQFDRLVKLHLPRCNTIRHTSRSQPFDNSVLGQYMTHLKGPRKAA